MENAFTGKLIVITAPSGAGKSTIAHYLLRKFSELSFSVSAATRAPRDGEQDGVDYYFISTEEFRRKVQQGDFLEWEMVYEGKYYGTFSSELDRIWNTGKVPVLDIDVKGALNVLEKYAGSVLSLFIAPPNVNELRNRLEGRGTETPQTLAVRLNKAAYELSFQNNFGRIIVNDNVERACDEAAIAVATFLHE